MLEMILMTQLYFTDGTYEFRNYNVLVRSEEECSKMGPNALKISRALATVDHPEVIHEKASCTDKKVILDFWPIPKNIPVPSTRPKGFAI